MDEPKKPWKLPLGDELFPMPMEEAERLLEVAKAQQAAKQEEKKSDA